MLHQIKSKILYILVIIAFFPQFVFAHSTGDHASGLVSGLLHPFAGIDHLIAMLGIGIWAGQLKGKSIWVLPLAFTFTLVLGGFFGVMGSNIPITETMILISLIFIGLMIALKVKVSLGLGVVVAMMFAFFHGHAHGTEMLTVFSSVPYLAGMVTTSIILQVLGLCLVIFCLQDSKNHTNKIIGSSILISGLILFFV